MEDHDAKDKDMKMLKIMYTRTPVIRDVTSPKQRGAGILRLKTMFGRPDPMGVLEDLARPARLSV